MQFQKGIINEKDIQYTFKILFLGDEITLQYRKSLLWKLYKKDKQVKSEENMKWEYTIPIELQKKIGQLKLTNYDNSISQERSYIPYQNTHLLVLVFDFKNESFKNIPNWFEQAKRFCNNKNLITIVVGVSTEITQHLEIPENVKQILSDENKVYYFNYTTENTDEFISMIDKYAVIVRKEVLTDDIIDQKLEKDKNFVKSIETQSAISRKTISEQKKIVIHDDNKDQLITFNEKGISIELKTLLLGDKCMTDLQRKFAVGYTNGWKTDFKQFGFDDIPATCIKDDEKEIRLKMNVFEHVSGKGQANTPWINVLAVVLCFDYNNNDSFTNLMKWYNDSIKYCNMKTVKFIVMGFNKSQNAPVKNENLEAFINYFQEDKKPQIIIYEENIQNQIERTLKQFFEGIIQSNFPKEYIESYKQKHPLNEKKDEKELSNGCILL